MNGARLIVRALEAAGVRYAFGIAGHGNLPILDALLDSQIRYIGMTHEQLAVHAADAYYRVSGLPAVVVTSVGPGLSNTLTGLGDALLDSSATLIIAGDVPTDSVGRGALQELSVLGAGDNSTPYRSYCKRVTKPAHPARLGDALVEAYNYATSGNPGPTLLDVPLDLQVREAGAPPDLHARQAGPQDQLPDPQLVRKAALLIRRASRPLLYVGGGVRSPEAVAALRELVARVGLPVATTMSGLGVLPGDHPLCLGSTGVVGCQPANQAVRESDLIIAIGTRFPEMDTSTWSSEQFAAIPPTTLVHVDLDATVIGRQYPTEVGIIADAASFLRELSEALGEGGDELSTCATWRANQIKANAAWRELLNAAEEDDSSPFSPQYVLATLRRALGDSVTLISGVGVRHTVAQHFWVNDPRQLIVGSGYGTMGQEPPAVIGATLAAPGTPVVGIVGDGALLTSPGVLATAAQYQIPGVWVVLNNGGYASINIYQMRHYERALGTMLEYEGRPYTPDYVALANAFGVEAIRVDDATGLAHAVSQIPRRTRPLLIELPVTSTPHLNSSGYWPVNDLLAEDARTRITA